MSNVNDAIALVSARSNYQLFAVTLEARAYQEEKANRPLTAKVWRHRAERCRKAAMAELVNPDPK